MLREAACLCTVWGALAAAGRPPAEVPKCHLTRPPARRIRPLQKLPNTVPSVITSASAGSGNSMVTAATSA